MKLTSPAFQNGEPIPERYTCEGEDLSPALHIEGVPHAAQSLVLIVEDPDAPKGTFTHWLLWNLSTQLTDLPEGLPQEETVPGLSPAVQGKNDFGTIGYRGPCPPPGSTHHYHFRLLALNATLRLNPGSDQHRLHKELEGKIMEETELVGTFGR
jgi:Raf kinase inhibitor-like YbhB/YbcL family protein